MKKNHAKMEYDYDALDSDDNELRFNYIRLHLGTNSIGLTLLFVIFTVVAFMFGVLKWSYLKGIADDLSFFIGMLSVIIGIGFYSFWSLGEKSVYALHFANIKNMPKGVDEIFNYKGLIFGVSKKLKEKITEIPSIFRQIFCVGIFLNLMLITMGNAGFDKLKKLPSEILETEANYCPAKEDAIDAPPKAGCELIVRAFKLGYAKDLGICEPKEIAPEKLEVCEKRRKDEPYLHYMSRLLIGSVEAKVEYFKDDRAKKIEDKFRLQLEQLEVLRDYQRYAISAAPRASHHIWTNLPYPENALVENYRKFFKPSLCIEQFQNQTNTVRFEPSDTRKNSKMLEHAYGQLLFNPKTKNTVAFCKEYKIHWDSEPDTCDRLKKDARAVLQESDVLDEVDLVLKRHDIANAILSLEDEIYKIENTSVSADSVTADKPVKVEKSTKSKKAKIVTGKIAKDKQQIRRKDELVSFQCFMQADATGSSASKVKLNDTNFLVRSRQFLKVEGAGNSQIAIYQELSKLLENRFHYSKLISRSDINIEAEARSESSDREVLVESSYLLTRLESLKNTDIFLGNQWVLERDDLLDVYPYHVHLKNYIESFRAEYGQSRGRL